MKEKKQKYMCYVCGKKVNIGIFDRKYKGLYIGGGKYRHYSCAPLTERWYRFGGGKSTEIGKELRRIMELLGKA